MSALRELKAGKDTPAGPKCGAVSPATWAIWSSRPYGVRGISGGKKCSKSLWRTPQGWPLRFWRKVIPSTAENYILLLLLFYILFEKQVLANYRGVKAECLMMEHQMTHAFRISSYKLCSVNYTKSKSWRGSVTILYKMEIGYPGSSSNRARGHK